MTSFHVLAAGESVAAKPEVQKITTRAVWESLRLGYRDFLKKPSHFVFLIIIYPVVGVALFMWASGRNELYLLLPMMSGFALIGPVAAVGLYEMSRRIESDLDTDWRHSRAVLLSPAMPAIIILGIMLLGLFLAWIYVAEMLYGFLYGPAFPESVVVFFLEVMTTSKGWTMIVIGNGIGFVFALVALSTTVVAFPLLLDRDTGAITAVKTSVRAVQVNPVPMLLWGAIVAAGLFLGVLTGMAGLIVALPVFGHATWHLYRRVVK